MDLRAATAIARSTVPIPECSCRLLPLQSKLPRAVPSCIEIKRLNRKFVVKAASSGDSKNGSGRPIMVDADMLVLRRRMNQLRMGEINYIPPQHWMEWEKRWFASYDSDVCGFLLWLQRMLLNASPSFTIGVFALISFSVPASVLLLLMKLLGHMQP